MAKKKRMTSKEVVKPVESIVEKEVPNLELTFNSNGMKTIVSLNKEGVMNIVKLIDTYLSENNFYTDESIPNETNLLQ